MRGFSFSWRRAAGISAFKSKVSRVSGIPMTRSGRQRKIGALASGALGSLLVEAASPRRRGRRARASADQDAGGGQEMTFLQKVAANVAVWGSAWLGFYFSSWWVFGFALVASTVAYSYFSPSPEPADIESDEGVSDPHAK
jgi:hypothetical protein